MAWRKSPPELIAAFARVVPAAGRRAAPHVRLPGRFVHGHMFAGLHEDRVVLRLDEAGIASEAARRHRFEPMPGRRMSGWVAVTGTLAADEPALRRGSRAPSGTRRRCRRRRGGRRRAAVRARAPRRAAGERGKLP